MSRRQDIRTDVFGGNDLLVRGGDFVVDEADVQHAQHLIESEQGHYKQWPLFGVGARRLLNGPANGEIRRTVQLQLVADGHESPQVGIDVNEKNHYPAMTTIPVEGIHGQTVWDVLLQYYGSVDEIGTFAAANGGLAIGEEVIAYQTVQLPDVPATRQDIVTDFTRRQRQITTY